MIKQSGVGHFIIPKPCGIMVGTTRKGMLSLLYQII
jgi:hypothetical protein